MVALFAGVLAGGFDELGAQGVLDVAETRVVIGARARMMKSLGTMRRPFTSTERWSSISRTDGGRVRSDGWCRAVDERTRPRPYAPDAVRVLAYRGQTSSRKATDAGPASEARRVRRRFAGAAPFERPPAAVPVLGGEAGRVSIRSSTLREWRNGRRASFRCWCPKGRGGSSPPSRTRNPLLRKGFLRVWRVDFYRTSTLARAKFVCCPGS